MRQRPDGFCLNPFHKSEVNLMSNMGLYIHIPFCIKKCNYCDFYSLSANENMYDEYVSDLLDNIKYWSNKLKNRTIDSVYFGGGTPSVLGTERLLRILSAVSEGFNLSHDTEITIEINPASNIKLDFNLLRKYSVNRISMGLQSSSDEELKLLGRAHTLADAEITINKIKSAGFDNFSLDVMLGIPLQTIESLKNTLDFCIKSNAKHISTYMLKIEKNTAFYYNRDNLHFADDDLQADMYEFTSNYLIKNGFRHYEISNFCKSNLTSRHNTKYWLLDDYLGLGPSAHSMIDGNRFYYPRDIKDFSIDNIVFESKGKTPDEYIMLSLRTDYGLSFTKYKELFDCQVSPEFMREAQNLEKLRMLNMDGDKIVLTEKGYLVSNAVISRLLSTGI